MAQRSRSARTLPSDESDSATPAERIETLAKRIASSAANSVSPEAFPRKPDRLDMAPLMQPGVPIVGGRSVGRPVRHMPGPRRPPIVEEGDGRLFVVRDARYRTSAVLPRVRSESAHSLGLDSRTGWAHLRSLRPLRRHGREILSRVRCGPRRASAPAAHRGSSCSQAVDGCLAAPCHRNALHCGDGRRLLHLVTRALRASARR